MRYQANPQQAPRFAFILLALLAVTAVIARPPAAAAERSTLDNMPAAVLAEPGISLPEAESAGTPVSSMADLTSARTITSIRSAWERWKPAYEDSPYSVAPSLKAPYAPGILQDDFIRDGLDMVNFMRYISDLPADLSADSGLDQTAQYGAVLQYAGGKLNHHPPQPPDMDETFYRIGYRASATSNLASGYSLLSDAVEGYMNDSDPGNIDRVGHRRWILSPQLQKVGFGFAAGFSSLGVFDRSRKETFQYDYIPYPSRNAFPLQFFEPTEAWSVSLNPELYAPPDPGSVTVTLTHTETGRSWKLDAGNRDMFGNYLSVSIDAYGYAPAVIFRPAFTDEEGRSLFTDGARFEVDVEGLKDKSGQGASIRYHVDFFDLEHPALRLMLEGSPLFLHPSPVLENDRVLVPMRPLFEALGARISWDAAAKTVTAARNGEMLTLRLGDTQAAVTDASGTVRTEELDVPAGVRGGTTYVPLAFAAESLGLQAGWDPASLEVLLTAPRAVSGPADGSAQEG